MLPSYRRVEADEKRFATEVYFKWDVEHHILKLRNIKF